MATNRGLKSLAPIPFEHITVMAGHGNSYAGLYDDSLHHRPDRTLTHAIDQEN